MAHKHRGLPGAEAGLTPVVEVDLLPCGKVVNQRAWRQTIINYLNTSQDKHFITFCVTMNQNQSGSLNLDWTYELWDRFQEYDQPAAWVGRESSPCRCKQVLEVIADKRDRLPRNLLRVLVVERWAEQVVQQQEGSPPYLGPLVTILKFSFAEKSKTANREKITVRSGRRLHFCSPEGGGVHWHRKPLYLVSSRTPDMSHGFHDCFPQSPRQSTADNGFKENPVLNKIQ